MHTISRLTSASRATTLTYRTNPTPSTKTLEEILVSEGRFAHPGTLPDSDQCSCTFPKPYLVRRSCRTCTAKNAFGCSLDPAPPDRFRSAAWMTPAYTLAHPLRTSSPRYRVTTSASVRVFRTYRAGSHQPPTGQPSPDGRGQAGSQAGVVLPGAEGRSRTADSGGVS
jgi:hypothetical protein